VTDITDHLADITQRVAFALERAGRAGDELTIVAVSKQKPAAAVRAAAAAGLRHFGENYLQEALPKIAEVADPAIVWHYIGRIQSNKTRQIAEHFDWVETVDRPRIAERLDAQRPPERGPLNVLIQVNLDDEPQKGGVGETGAIELAQRIVELPRLKLRGLMCIPPAGQRPAAQRASFDAVTALALRLREQAYPLDTISMGMSSDFELAIAAGATSIRIGTALFGARNTEP